LRSWQWKNDANFSNADRSGRTGGVAVEARVEGSVVVAGVDRVASDVALTVSGNNPYFLSVPQYIHKTFLTWQKAMV
jgi:hypothetical protein